MNARKVRNQNSPRNVALRYGRGELGKVVKVDFGTGQPDAWEVYKRANKKLARFLGLKS